jgi:hypothetical protein
MPKKSERLFQKGTLPCPSIRRDSGKVRLIHAAARPHHDRDIQYYTFKKTAQHADF